MAGIPCPQEVAEEPVLFLGTGRLATWWGGLPVEHREILERRRGPIVRCIRTIGAGAVSPFFCRISALFQGGDGFRRGWKPLMGR